MDQHFTVLTILLGAVASYAFTLVIARAEGSMFLDCLYIQAILVNMISQEHFEKFSLNFAKISTLTQG